MRVGFLWDRLTPNLGDQAIGTTFLRLARRAGCEALEPVRLEPGYSEAFDFFVIGGGELLQPEGHPFYDAFRVPGRHILNTVGTSGEVDAEHLHDYRLVSVRSEVDRTNLRRVGREVVVAPCLTVLFEEVARPVDAPPLPEDTIGVHLSPAAIDFDRLAESMALLNELGDRVRYFSFTPYNQDLRVARALGSAAGERECWTLGDPDEAFAAFGRMKAVICTSLHATIFAYVRQIPFLSVEYAPKVGHFLEERGLRQRAIGNLAEAAEKLHLLDPDRVDWSERLAGDRQAARSLAESMFAEIARVQSERKLGSILVRGLGRRWKEGGARHGRSGATWREPTRLGEAHRLLMSMYLEYGTRVADSVTGRALGEKREEQLAAADRRRIEVEEQYRGLERHARSLDNELRQRDEAIRERDTRLDEALHERASLGQAVERARSELEDERKRAAQAAAEAASQRDARIARLASELEELRERLGQERAASGKLRAELARLEQRLRDSERRTGEAERLIAALRSSLGWFALDRYWRTRNALLPQETHRRRLYDRLASYGKRLLHRRAAVRSAPAPAARTAERGTAETVVAPPAEWMQDPRRPPVVIAMASWNGVSHLRPCLESVFEHTTYERYRVCVFEQGSTDGSRAYLEELGERVDVVLNDANVGFVEANNAVLQRYREWDVVFLNNDTSVTRGWLDRLVATAYSAENIGLVGPKLLYPNGRLQEAGSRVFRDGSARAFGKHADPWSPEFNQIREVDYCSAACLFVKREALDACGGGFDERYAPAYYEDVDLAFAARAAGYKVIYEPRSTVFHVEYGSSEGRAFDLMRTNQKKFVQKWSEVLAAYPRSPWHIDSLRPRDRVLVVGDIVPAPDRSAGGKRLYQLLRLLARDFEVVYAFEERHWIEEYIRPLERLGIRTFFPGCAGPFEGDAGVDLRAILRDNDFQFVFCELHEIAERWLPVIREGSPNSVVLVDTYDLHYVRERREAELSSDPHLLEAAARTKQRELATYRGADVIVAITEQEKEILLAEQPELDVEVIPLIYDLPAKVAPRTARHDLLFVGGFSHRPNVDAARYLCQEIFPRVKERLPGVRLYVTGNAPPPEVLAFGSKDIIVTGYVPHLPEYLDSALVSVAPLRFGSGTKGKIGEAMAYGLPVVTTTLGAEGMDLVDGRDVLIAETPEEFAESIARLHREPELWESISRAGRSRLTRTWSVQAVEEIVSQFVRHLQSRRKQRLVETEA